METEHFEPGTRIILFGLQKQQLNGKCGIAMEWVPANERYKVQVEDMYSNSHKA